MKVAAYVGRDAQDARHVVERMLAGQRQHDWQRPHVVGLATGAIGWLTTFDRATRIPLVRQEANGNVLVMSGVPVDVDGQLERRLAGAAAADCDTVSRELAPLDGAFAALHWDHAARTLTVVTDFLGMQPIYVRTLDDGVVAATELRAIAASGLARVDLDPLGWATLVSFGHFAEDATSIRGVRRLPGATVLRWGAATASVDESRYWAWPAPQPALRLENIDTGAIAHHFRDHLLAYEIHHPSATVLLSGGFDSRWIVATLSKEGRQPHGIVLSHADEHDDADGRLAVKLARACGLRYEVVQQRPDFFSSAAFIEYLMANEVGTPSFGLFIAQLWSAIAGRAEAVWDGLAPTCSVRTVRQERGGFDAFFERQTRGGDAATWNEVRQVFAPAIACEMEEAFRRFVSHTREIYRDDEYGVAEFVTRSRMRNRTGPNPLKVYANDAAPFTPGLSKGMWELTAGIPFDVKANFALYMEIFRQQFPALTRLPVCSGGVLYSLASFNPAFVELQLRGRFMKRYGVARLARRLGWRPPVSDRSTDIVSRTLERVDPGHPDLNADGVALLRAGHGAGARARMWLFYWQMWRWVMDGSIRTRMADLVTGS